jgi:hypothetical protein
MPIFVHLIGGWPRIYLASWLSLQVRLAIFIEIEVSSKSDWAKGYLRPRSTLYKLECDINSVFRKSKVILSSVKNAPLCDSLSRELRMEISKIMTTTRRNSRKNVLKIQKFVEVRRDFVDELFFLLQASQDS